MDTWADTRIWNWTGLGEARMPASSFGFFIQGSFLLRPQPLVYDEGEGQIILCIAVKLSQPINPLRPPAVWNLSMTCRV